jgi:5-methylcytosine-specific restriction endonuclease McrA
MADDDNKKFAMSRKEAKERGDAFYQGAPCYRGHDGIRYAVGGHCVKCIAAERKLKGWTEKDNVRDRKYRSRPENKKRRSEQRKILWQRDKDRINAIQREKNSKKTKEERQKKSEYNSQYYQNNKERQRAASHRYEARKRGNGGTHTAEDIADIRRMQKDKCAMPFCRIKLRGKGEVDHIVALKNKGSNDRKNLQLLCRHCNSSKKATDQIEYVRRQGFLL